MVIRQALLRQVKTPPPHAFGSPAIPGISLDNGKILIYPTGGGSSVSGGQNLSTDEDDSNNVVSSQKTASQQAYTAAGYNTIPHARDGADLYVPGGTGVDSKLIQMAVSPGESVHVRTPAQQAAGNGGGNSQNVSFTVNTPDANSFQNSQAQIQRKLVRGLRRAGRN